MNYWLVKTEPEIYSIDNLAKDKSTEWTGVRNYQARNFLKAMTKGDRVIIYHSNANPPAVAGIGEVFGETGADLTQFDKRSELFDPKATKDAPRWFAPKIKFVSKFAAAIPLDSLRSEKRLSSMLLLKKGSRLSVQPVSKEHFQIVCKLGGQ